MIQMVNMMTMRAMNCISTRSRISRCEQLEHSLAWQRPEQANARAGRRRIALACQEQRDAVDELNSVDENVECFLRPEATRKGEGRLLHVERCAQVVALTENRRRRDRVREH